MHSKNSLNRSWFGSTTLWELINLNIFDVETKVLTGAIKWVSLD